ncbi:hypothetical protein QYM36_015484 [Artemia franciscana]|uniref:ENTH domain-containing protein n=1 Tax=Artemia franciscana TaxID=6661 RepID=A0AA88HAC8_ARTSF|nr:hypothetical protein QYM36_015484 [Artemia franciscana]
MNFRKIKRSMKNTFQGYSSVEILTREATCNDKSYPTLEVMDEVARLTHDSVKLHQIMEVIHKRIFEYRDYVYYWRHVHKAITLLDYLFTYGSEKVLELSNEWYDKIACLVHFCEHGVCDSSQELLTKLDEWRRNASKKALGNSASRMSMTQKVSDETLGASGREKPGSEGQSLGPHDNITCHNKSNLFCLNRKLVIHQFQVVV